MRTAESASKRWETTARHIGAAQYGGQAMEKIYHGAQLAKADICKYAALSGLVNSADVALANRVFSSGTLKFWTFEGMLNVRTGLYEGVYRFEHAPKGFPQESLCGDLNELPGLADKPKRARKVSAINADEAKETSE